MIESPGEGNSKFITRIVRCNAPRVKKVGVHLHPLHPLFLPLCMYLEVVVQDGSHMYEITGLS